VTLVSQGIPNIFESENFPAYLSKVTCHRKFSYR